MGKWNFPKIYSSNSNLALSAIQMQTSCIRLSAIDITQQIVANIISKREESGVTGPPKNESTVRELPTKAKPPYKKTCRD